MFGIRLHVKVSVVGIGCPFLGFLTFSFVFSVHNGSFNLESFMQPLSITLKYCPVGQQWGIHERPLQKSSVQIKTWSTFVVLLILSRLTHDLTEIQGTFIILNHWSTAY